jgi:hypothetical protein
MIGTFQRGEKAPIGADFDKVTTQLDRVRRRPRHGEFLFGPHHGKVGDRDTRDDDSNDSNNMSIVAPYPTGPLAVALVRLPNE